MNPTFREKILRIINEASENERLSREREIENVNRRRVIFYVHIPYEHYDDFIDDVIDTRWRFAAARLGSVFHHGQKCMRFALGCDNLLGKFHARIYWDQTLQIEEIAVR